MTEILRSSKALTVSPLKASQPLGASIAMLGMDRCVPLFHGAQGCTAFAKVFLVRHYREPIPLQTTAMDQISAVMGADDSLLEALVTICSRSRPDIIPIITTGLSETEGADVARVVREFRQRHPEYQAVAVVPVSTADYVGCAETGFAVAVQAVIEHLVPASRCSGSRPRQVNLLPGMAMTAGDVEAMRDMVEAFGLEALILPDVSGSLDGHLGPERLSATTTGGLPVADLPRLGESAMTLVIGASMNSAADLLHERTGVPDLRFDSLMGMGAMDRFLLALARISGRPVPARYRREREHLQDAMLDTHFMLGFSRLAIAADGDLLHGFTELVTEMGAEVVAALAPIRSPVLERIQTPCVRVGDLQDLEQCAREAGAQCLLCNTHGLESARRLGIPLMRIGFPQYDRVGGFQRCWTGYAGARHALFDLANLLLESRPHGVSPYRSIYAPEDRDKPAEVRHGVHASTAGGQAPLH